MIMVIPVFEVNVTSAKCLNTATIGKMVVAMAARGRKKTKPTSARAERRSPYSVAPLQQNIAI